MAFTSVFWRSITKLVQYKLLRYCRRCRKLNLFYFDHMNRTRTCIQCIVNMFEMNLSSGLQIDSTGQLPPQLKQLRRNQKRSKCCAPTKSKQIVILSHNVY